ncbi:hypothetical protein [Bacterioplanoides sp.]|uniref:hypothetical protein n=1 Tax=Bacterioplanoides sp. TaxID=2066072 RepID=UPI003B5A0490
MEPNKLLLAMLAVSTLTLTACGGGGGSSSSPEETPAPIDNAGNTDNAGDTDNGGNTDNGGDQTSAPQWSTPVALTDGSNYTSLELFDGAGNKPMMVTQKHSTLYSREFDGSNWSDETQISPIFSVNQLDWDVNSNGKAVMAISTQPVNPSSNFRECALTYFRYDGNHWDSSNSVTARLLRNPNGSYSCSNVGDFNVALAGDDSLLMTWYRRDLDNSYYQYCGSNNQCATNPEAQANSIGSRFIRGIGLGNDGKGRVLRFNDTAAGSVLIAGFDTAQGEGLGSSNLASSPSIRSKRASMAVNDASHSLVVFDEGRNLQARFDNGSSLSPAVTLADDLPALGAPILRTYLSDGSDYGLTLWREFDNTTKQTPLRSNISDASAFEASSIQHQSEGEIVHYRFSGDINDNGKAVIAWFGYSVDANNDREPATLYSRIYDGNRWLDAEIIDNNIDTNDLSPLKMGVYIDNSDEVTLVYTAKKTDQDIQTEPAPKLFYSRFSTSNSHIAAARLQNNSDKQGASKEEAEQIKAELEGAGAEVEVK